MNKPTRRGEEIHAPRRGDRIEPTSVHTLACRAVKAWRTGQGDALDEAMATLEERLGVALLEAA